ncbi:hypothetical protein IWQ56_003319 [Coemansia nantahalensis]|uniref:Uncharacterized protein n=1 Tax=Coemansia helicoidea TaxID=1286919 RepID=A0ACC1LFZ8_9FUNG|nr:hypothetical protein IWQ56_003319 [Coemansia nantahalensis]KAJ2807993.1 hypothetical protein H4R21_000254 [Coemansia helicoidea]
MVNLAALPEELKHIQAYLQRGQEIAQADAVVSYSCKYYAARQSISAPGPAAQQFVTGLLDELEAEKAQLVQQERLKSDAEAAHHCTVFALKVFAKADTEDREGRATKATARNFIVSSQFLQVVAAYGDLPPDVAEKIKYAKWRATEILKAVREGRPPVPPPAADDSPAPPAVSAGDIMGWPSPPVQQTPPPQQPLLPGRATSPAWSGSSYPDVSTPQPLQQPPQPLQQPVAYYPSSQPGAAGVQADGLPSVPRNRLPADTAPANTRPAQATPPSAATFIPMPAANLPPVSPQAPDGAEGLMLDPTDAKAAQKFARWAISALEYDDVATAVDNLQRAIGVLARYQR